MSTSHNSHFYLFITLAKASRTCSSLINKKLYKTKIEDGYIVFRLQFLSIINFKRYPDGLLMCTQRWFSSLSLFSYWNSLHPTPTSQQPPWSPFAHHCSESGVLAGKGHATPPAAGVSGQAHSPGTRRAGTQSQLWPWEWHPVWDKPLPLLRVSFPHFLFFNINVFILVEVISPLWSQGIHLLA